MLRILMLALMLLALPVAAQTQAKSPAPAAPTSPANAPAPTPAPPPPVPPKLNPDDVCKGRPGCKMLWSQDVGDVNNKHLIISEVVLPFQAKNDWEKCHRPQDKRFGEFMDNVRQEIWLSTFGGLLTDHKKIFEFCNNGYGSANIGEDTLSFDTSHITYRQAGGSNDRWVWTRRYQLPSMAYSATVLCDSRTTNTGGHIRVMDYETGAFTSGYTPQDADDASSNFADCGVPDVEIAKPKYRAIDTKQIYSFLGIKLDSIKKLGTCATTMTSRAGAHHGFVTYGQDDGADVEIKYLRINDDKLWVDIRDAGRTFNTTDDWASNDRIEIWWLDQKQMPSLTNTNIEDAPRKALRQFAVRLSDLKVFAGYGYSPNQKLPVVERRDGEFPLAFQITWPAEQFPSAAGLTLSYAHADGHSTKVMWSSSAFRYPDPQSLAAVNDLQGKANDPREVCTVTKDGVLDLIVPPGL